LQVPLQDAEYKWRENNGNDGMEPNSGSEYTYCVIINDIKSISRYSNFLQPGIIKEIPLDESDLPFPNFLISHAVPAMVLLLLLLARFNSCGAALQAKGIIPKARE
jgi:hypothetical protein